jgi:hypothetical protein
MNIFEKSVFYLPQIPKAKAQKVNQLKKEAAFTLSPNFEE